MNLSLLSWLSTQLVTFLGESEALAARSRVLGVAFVAVYAAIGPVTVWQLVGAWRSARRHIEETGRRFWARAVQVSVGIGAVVSAAAFAVPIPLQAWEFGKLALGIDPMPMGAIRTVAGGREIAVQGYIGMGTTARVRALLDENPEVKTIHLNSPGGRVGEGRTLRDLISSRHLTTYTSAGCLSACAIAFSGGTNRVLQESAKLGFHQYDLPGWGWQGELEYARDIAVLVNSGIDEEFARKTVSEPFDKMWHPTTEELLEAGFVTSVSDGHDFAILIDEPREWAEGFVKGLRTTPIFRVLAEHDPVGQEAMTTKITEILRGSGTLAEMRVVAHEAAHDALARYLPHARDAELTAFVEHVKTVLDQLGDENPGACAAYLQGSFDGASAAAALSPELAQAEVDVIASTIESGASARVPFEPGAAELNLMDGIFARLENAYGVETVWVLNDPDSYRADPEAICRANRLFYEELRKLPESEAGLVVRGTVARTSPVAEVGPELSASL